MDLLKRLIAIPSESGNEKAIADFISDWLLERDIQSFRHGDCVMALIPGVDRTKAFILNGHTDTVPAGDHSKWTYGPHTPQVVGDELYGLGSSDMKAGVAGILEIAEQYQTTSPPCDIWCSFVPQEETSGHGTESFLQWFKENGYFDNYSHIEALIAEPTDCAYIGTGHRGNYFVTVAIPAATKELANVLESLASGVKKLETTWQQTYGHPALGKPTIGLTGIAYDSNGSAPATLMLDIRTTPSLHGVAPKELADFVATYSAGATVTVDNSCPVGWCPDDAEILAVAEQYFTNLDTHVIAMGSTDLCFFSEQAIPCIIYGPGQREKMHSTDETFTCSKLGQFKADVMKMVSHYA